MTDKKTLKYWHIEQYKCHCTINNTVLTKKEASTETKMKMYNTVVILTLTYENETWPMTGKLESKMTALGMRFLKK